MLLRKMVLRGVLGLALVCSLTELGLQIGARFAGTRGAAGRPEATVRILCLGDSHTYGIQVERDQAYPAQLQRLLDEDAPRVHAVVNLGVPGMSTTQLRNRLGDWLSRYDPDLIVVWAGVNNAWNRAEWDSDSGAWRARLDGMLMRSRLYRLVRVAWRDWELERHRPGDVETDEAEVRIDEVENPFGPRETHVMVHDGITERIEHRRESRDPDAEMVAEGQARAERDLELIVLEARSSGVPVVLVTYPVELRWFAVANGAVRAVAQRRGLPLVEAGEALARIPRSEWQWKWGLHPDARMYGEIAADVQLRVQEVLEAELKR